MLLTVGILITFLVLVLSLVLYLTIEKKVSYKDLLNKHVLITGGSSGIGKSAAIEAARRGAHVSIIGRDENKLKSAVEEITSQCLDKSVQSIQYAVLDVTSDYFVIEKAINSLEDNVGPIFMLVNCAGMCICGKFEQMKVEDIKQMIDLNYFGSAYMTKCVLPGMKKKKEGLIVFVCSEAALIGIYGYTAYSAGKWAVRGLAEALSMELIGTGVRVMISYPPDTDTPGFKNEDLTKPLETKLISGSAGLLSPDVVGKQMIDDALNGKMYSVYTTSGSMLTTLFGGSIDSVRQILLQVFSMGVLRAVMVGVLLSFHKIVRDNLKLQNNSKNK
ncbi:3-ketodihydrosphingosine reductase [Bombyx mori]|uniref:3-dehydrosphinganine reductase n=1 Tax=Bombyx mori TaxID=7091 RepID=A0A8R2AUP7_BOMMO|nr:3-ketodihydrosphingosine reductase [Bombyx mori]